MDHFDRLGLPRRFSLNATDLEREYLAAQPSAASRFPSSRLPTEQAASVELSAALNEAYATLKDPFRRAEYLLKLDGGPRPRNRRTCQPSSWKKCSSYAWKSRT